MTTNMTTKEIKELALQILNRNGETGIKKSDFTVRQAKQLIKEYNLGWMKQKGKKNMKRKECEKQIIDLMIQIRDVYRKYNAGGEYLSLAIMGDTLMADNMGYTDDADHPLDIYYVIEQREEEHDI